MRTVLYLEKLRRSGAWRSLPLSARENADLMDFLSFIRWLAGQGKKKKMDRSR